MKNKYFFIFVFVTVLLISCSLERSNPVDPQNNPDIKEPGEVSDINLTPSTSSSVIKFMEIEWNSIPDIDGYYIYRARTYDGEYIRVDNNGGDQGISPETMYYRDTEVQADELYYYRISAYKNIEEFILEGRRSTPRYGIVK